MTPIEDAINNLTTQTTALLDSVNFSKDSLQSDIAAAIVVSENASQIPLVTIATSIINTQATFVTYISGGN
jgi:hypothetical protein